MLHGAIKEIRFFEVGSDVAVFSTEADDIMFNHGYVYCLHISLNYVSCTH